MRRVIRALMSALVALGVSKVGYAEEAKPNANDCMSFQNDVLEKSIAVHASNVCERKLSCTLSYAVRCEDNAGKVTTSASASTRFSLKAHGDTELTMSADQCKQGWNIDNVAWVCS